MIRRFTIAEERALAKLNALETGRFMDVTRDHAEVYERMSVKGLTTVVLRARQKRARLTKTGRYFAELVALRARSQP
jgi:hypothetical protein